eukprot:GSMAST32.ASY1.ANO1.1863.1 assembled CDS
MSYLSSAFASLAKVWKPRVKDFGFQFKRMAVNYDTSRPALQKRIGKNQIKENKNISQTTSGNVNVVSWNLLSANFSNPSYFIESDPKHLLPSNRIRDIQAHLLPHLMRGSIICLQEVSQDWQGILNCFFEKYGYNFISSCYSTSQVMGVAIAYPQDKYSLQKCDISTLAKSWEADSSLDLVKDFKNARMRDNIFLYVGLKERSTQYSATSTKTKTTKTTKNRKNKSRQLNNGFGIATYHMPCAFTKPLVMLTHSSLMVNRIHELSKSQGDDTPFILAGDFNFKPEDSTYELYVFISIPIFFWYEISVVDWLPTVPGSLTSCYHFMNGKEPTFTNFAFTDAMTKSDDSDDMINDPFCETLDYILCSKHWTPRQVIKLPTRDELNNRSMPNESQPSDHLLIGATLSLNESY